MFHYKSNIGYYAKIFVLPIAAGLLFILACGDDDPEPPSLSEQLVGSWEIISIDGETLEEAVLDEFGEEERLDAEFTKKEYVFAANGSVFVNFGASIVFTEGAVSVTVSFTLTGKGTYTVSGSTLTTILEDVHITLEPEDLWASSGVTAQDFEEEFNPKFEIEHADIDLSGDWLTLTHEDGSKTVLKKR